MPVADSSNFSSQPCIVYLHVKSSVNISAKAVNEHTAPVEVDNSHNTHLPVSTAMKLKPKRRPRVSYIQKENETNVDSVLTKAKESEDCPVNDSSESSYEFSLESYKPGPLSSSSDCQTLPLLRERKKTDVAEAKVKETTHSSEQQVLSDESVTGNKKIATKIEKKSSTGAKKYKFLAEKKKSSSASTSTAYHPASVDSVSEKKSAGKEVNNKNAPIFVKLFPSESVHDSKKKNTNEILSGSADENKARKKLFVKKDNGSKQDKNTRKRMSSSSVNSATNVSKNVEVSESNSFVLSDTHLLKKQILSLSQNKSPRFNNKSSLKAFDKKVPVVLLERLSMDVVKEYCTASISFAASDLIASMGSVDKDFYERESFVDFSGEIKKGFQKEETSARNVEKWLQNVNTDDMDNAELEQLSTLNSDEKISVTGSSSSLERQVWKKSRKRKKNLTGSPEETVNEKRAKIYNESSAGSASVSENENDVSANMKKIKQNLKSTKTFQQSMSAVVQNDTVDGKFLRVVLERLPMAIVNKYSGKEVCETPTQAPLFEPISDVSEFSVSIPSIHLGAESAESEISAQSVILTDKDSFDKEKSSSAEIVTIATEKTNINSDTESVEKSDLTKKGDSLNQSARNKKIIKEKKVSPNNKAKKIRIPSEISSISSVSTEPAMNREDVQAKKCSRNKSDVRSKVDSRNENKPDDIILLENVGNERSTSTDSVQKPTQEDSEVNPHRSIQNRKALIRINFKKKKGTKKISPKQRKIGNSLLLLKTSSVGKSGTKSPVTTASIKSKKNKNVSKRDVQVDKESHTQEGSESVMSVEDSNVEKSKTDVIYSTGLSRKHPKGKREKNGKKTRTGHKMLLKVIRSLSSSSSGSDLSLKKPPTSRNVKSDKNAISKKPKAGKVKPFKGISKNSKKENVSINGRNDRNSDDFSAFLSKKSDHKNSKTSQKYVQRKDGIGSQMQKVRRSRSPIEVSNVSAQSPISGGLSINRAHSSSSKSNSSVYCSVKLHGGNYVDVGMSDLFKMFNMSPIVVLTDVDKALVTDF